MFSRSLPAGSRRSRLGSLLIWILVMSSFAVPLGVLSIMSRLQLRHGSTAAGQSLAVQQGILALFREDPAASENLQCTELTRRDGSKARFLLSRFGGESVAVVAGVSSAGTVEVGIEYSVASGEELLRKLDEVLALAVSGAAWTQGYGPYKRLLASDAVLGDLTAEERAKIERWSNDQAVIP